MEPFDSGLAVELGLLLALVPNNLRKVGEAMSGYLQPGCLKLVWLVEVGLDLGELDRETLSESETDTFSLSVWLMVTGLHRPEPILVGSLRLVLEAALDLLLTLESILLELERCPPRATIPLELDLAGRGRLRYCRGFFELTSKTPSSWFWEPSRLVLRPPFPLSEMAEDLGIFPSVAEPLVTVAPLAVIRAPDPVFLNPKEPVVGGLAMPEGGFFPSSPLLFPASEGDRCMLLEGTFPFSEALASSVLPCVLRVPVAVLVRGGVIPTCAVMPLLQDPV